jgi:hypothetical protein
MKKQITIIAVIVTFMVGLMASVVTAQKINNGFAPVGFYSGIETMQGTPDINNSMIYGNSFVLTSSGEWKTHHLSVSLNYSTNSFYPNNFIVTGGSWSLVVVRNNKYSGTLYGEVQTGSVNLISDDSGTEISKQVQVNLKANGGLGIFNGRGSKGISGVYDMVTDLRSKETTGNASFTF